MKPKSLSISLFLLFSVAAFCVPARGKEPPRRIFLGAQQNYLAAQQNPQPPQIAPVYVKKDTWHETMRASLEATFGATVRAGPRRSGLAGSARRSSG